jgi:adenylate cyclase
MNGESSRTTETRKLAAIMFTDMVGFSRQMGVAEARMLRLLEVHNHVIRQAVTEQQGVVIKTIGDAFLVDFPSVVNAVHCAQQIQAQFHAHNAAQEKADQIHVRIGIHLGDIVQKDGDVFGDGVNIASRLQSLAEPDTICISDMVYRDVAKKLDLGTMVSLGQPKLKNIAERFQVYALLSEAPKGLQQKLQVQRFKLSRRLRPAYRIALVGTMLIVATLGLVHYFSPSPPKPAPPTTPEFPPLPDKPSIVIRPFANLIPESGQAYFSKGLAFDLTADLSKVSSLFVIASGTADSLAPDEPIAQVGKKLKIRHVLDGSVRKVGEQVQITVQLSDAVEGHLLWSERYDREFKDIFKVLDEIRQKIVTALKVKLTPEEQERFHRAPTANLEAYDYYLRGVEYFSRTTKETTAQARQLFEKAIELDSHYAAAYAQQGMTYTIDWVWQWNRERQILDHAFAAAQTALALDDSLPLAHSILGTVYQYRGQFAQGIAEGERAVALEPNNPDNHRRLSSILGFAGRAEDAIEEAQEGMRLNPHYPPQYLLTLGQAYHQAWRNDEAIVTLKRLLVSNPNHMAAHVMLACSYSDAGRNEEARAEVAEVLRLSPQFTTEIWRGTQFFQDPAELERHAKNLQKAGLK